MPRQDVPYGGAICRLKERIAEIFDKLGEKLHTINGVPGDGDGNVKIVSGSSAVVISNDPTQNEIAVSLDTSQLPAAAVSSVNGQTGAVALDAGDIPTVGGDVQADLQDLANDISGNTAAINAEVLARQGADSALQTNINNVSASLPAAAAAAVAADPTIAQLVIDLGNKVDLSDVSTVETPDTIAKRNGSGRLVAADPASGATDKTLVTANWISQTGNAAPNNLLHRTANETVLGRKAFEDGAFNKFLIFNTPAAGNHYVKISFVANTAQIVKFKLFSFINNQSSSVFDCVMLWNGGSNRKVYVRRLGSSVIPIANFKMAYDGSEMIFLFNCSAYHTVFANIENSFSWTNNLSVNLTHEVNPDLSGLTLENVTEM